MQEHTSKILMSNASTIGKINELEYENNKK